MALTPLYNNDAGSTARTKINAAFTAIDNQNLVDISGLSPFNDDTMQYISGSWKSRTVVQAKTTLGLNNVTNTSDANKPVSTATQTALDLKQDEGTTSTLLLGVKNFAGTVTADDTYLNTILVIENAAPTDFNFPDDGTEPNLVVGSQILVHNSATSAGNVTLQASGGATLLFSGVLTGTLATKGSALVIKIAADTWLRHY
jgi:hypothetical protein